MPYYIKNQGALHFQKCSFELCNTYLRLKKKVSWVSVTYACNPDPEIRRIEVPSQPGQIVQETLS
jgi:hypothetical protein